MLGSGNKQEFEQHHIYPLSPPLSSFSPMSNKANSTTILSPQSFTESFLNLDKMVQTYVHQPELLELILSSKVEEDRRRAEEAKLRQKEIDYILSHQQQRQQKEEKRKPSLPPLQRLTTQLPSLTSSSGNNSPQESRRHSSSIEMLLSPSNHLIKLPEIALTPSSSTNTASFNTTEKHSQLDSSVLPHGRKRSYYTSEQEKSRRICFPTCSAPPSPPSESKRLFSSQHKRRRREMQPITTIIETKEFPYNDDYLWKNNGNTIHKKTGFKSIYYKCSNNAKGCPVNKTVTFKNNGEYLIKYRGQHFPECKRIKRITDL
ncbi:MAG: hypothetical protein EXX96DRAFT_562392 [Benjaminiella poitrasii]|nr:MAG: hypothetical protein EXX96DRAFT_562392 [Benjaminiella poitrasii]